MANPCGLRRVPPARSVGACALLLAAVVASAAPGPASATAGQPLVAGTGKLACTGSASSGYRFHESVSRALDAHKLRPTIADAQWLAARMTNDLGIKTPIPGGESARLAAAMGSMMRANSFVAAYILGDFERMVESDFGRSEFALATVDYIRISLQPMQHAPHYGTSAAGGEAHAHRETAALSSILKRIADAKSTLGDLYAVKPVRFYVLSYAFGDPVGASMARDMACSLKLAPEAEAMIDKATAGAAMTQAERSAALNSREAAGARIVDRLRSAAFMPGGSLPRKQ